MKKTMRILFLAAMIVVMVMMTALIVSAEGEVEEGADDAYFMVTDADGNLVAYYSSLENAVLNVPENGTVTMLHDYSAPDAGYADGEHVKIMLQHSFTLDGYSPLEDMNCAFITTNGGAIRTWNHAPDAVMTIKNIVVEGEGCYGFDFNGKGNFILYNCEITAGYAAIHIGTAGVHVTLADDPDSDEDVNTITSTDTASGTAAIQATGSSNKAKGSTLTIDNADITGGYNGIRAASEITITVNGGSIAGHADREAIYMVPDVPSGDEYYVNINGGTLSAQCPVRADAGNCVVTYNNFDFSTNTVGVGYSMRSAGGTVTYRLTNGTYMTKGGTNLLYAQANSNIIIEIDETSSIQNYSTTYGLRLNGSYVKSGATVTLKGNGKLDYSTIATNAVLWDAADTTLNIEGNLTIHGKSSAMYVGKTSGVVINIKSGTLVGSTTMPAIYINNTQTGTGTLNITGGTICAQRAIDHRSAGTWNINVSGVTAKLKTLGSTDRMQNFLDLESSGAGIVTLGAGNDVTTGQQFCKARNAASLTINITGGTYDSTGRFIQADKAWSSTGAVHVNITGGTFTCNSAFVYLNQGDAATKASSVTIKNVDLTVGSLVTMATLAYDAADAKAVGIVLDNMTYTAVDKDAQLMYVVYSCNITLNKVTYNSFDVLGLEVAEGETAPNGKTGLVYLSNTDVETTVSITDSTLIGTGRASVIAPGAGVGKVTYNITNSTIDGRDEGYAIGSDAVLVDFNITNSTLIGSKVLAFNGVGMAGTVAITNSKLVGSDEILNITNDTAVVSVVLTDALFVLTTTEEGDDTVTSFGSPDVTVTVNSLVAIALQEVVVYGEQYLLADAPTVYYSLAGTPTLFYLYIENAADDETLVPVLDGNAEVEVAFADLSLGGLRFISTVSADAQAALLALQQNGATLEFGTLIAPADHVAAARSFTEEALTAAVGGDGVGYVKIKANLSKVDADEDGIPEAFSGALINLKNYTRAYAAVSYVAVTVDGETTVYYGAFNTVNNARSAQQIATEIIDNPTSDYNNGVFSAEQKAVLDAYKAGIVAAQ